MEFINAEKHYFQLVKDNCDHESIDALRKEFFSYQLEGMRHESDNGFLSNSFGETILNLSKRSEQLIGFCLCAPSSRHYGDCAIVIDDISGGNKRWCHVLITTLEWWKEQVKGF